MTDHPSEDFSPAWSRDGKYIAFLRDPENRQIGLYRIPAHGGAEVKLGEIAGPLLPWERTGPYIVWTPDSRSLVISDHTSPGEPRSLFLFSIEDGARLKLTSPPPGSRGDVGPAFAPASQSIAFLRGGLETGFKALHTLRLDNSFSPVGPPERITASKQFLGGPAWAPDGHRLIIGSVAGLSEVPSSDNKGEKLLGALRKDVSWPAVSASARRLVYSTRTNDTNIWRLEIGKPGSARRFISSTRAEGTPKYSPDGRSIVFHSSRSGSSNLWLCKSDGSSPRQITRMDKGGAGSPRWSPSGTLIAFDSRPKAQPDIYVIHSSGANLVRMTDHPAADICPSWSRDGKWLYFGSNRTGQYQIWKMPAAGGRSVQVTRQGGTVAVPSPHVGILYYAKEVGNTSLWRMPEDGGQEAKVLPDVWYLQFEVTKNGIYFIPQQRGIVGGTSIRFYSFETRKTSQIADIRMSALTHLAVSPNEQFLLYTQDDNLGSDLMLVENFR